MATNWISFDIETDGELAEYALQPWRVNQGKAWLTTAACTYYTNGKKHEPGVIAPTKTWLERMLRFAIKTKRPIVGWNISFDIGWLFALGLDDLIWQVKWLDGMRIWRHYFIEPEYDTLKQNKKSYSLKDAVREYLPTYANYEEGVHYHAPTPEQLVELLAYNKIDTRTALMLSWYFWNLLDDQQKKAAEIEAYTLPFAAWANWHGMEVDQDQRAKLEKAMEERELHAEFELAGYGATEKVLKSPMQLQKLIFDDWGLEPIKINKQTGGRSTDKEVLYELAPLDSRAGLLRNWREAINLKSKFLKTLEISPRYNGDNRTHPSAFVFGTYTSRMTYASTQGKNKDKRQTGFAIHQMKNDKEFRKLIRAPEGYDLGEADASGQEFRWMAIASGDETMLRLCLPGEDPHSYMGAKIAQREYDWVKAHKEDEAKSMRKAGKVGNLSLQYRTSAPKLLVVSRVQYNIPMVIDEARAIHATYQETYPGVPEYWEDQIAFGKKFGYAKTLAGRRVEVKGRWFGAEGWRMESTMINYPIQGTGGDQKYLAIAVLKAYMVKEGIYFAFDLHDGLYFYIPSGKGERCMREMKYLLDRLPYKSQWGITPPIPLTFDIKLAKASDGPASWGNLKELADA